MFLMLGFGVCNVARTEALLHCDFEQDPLQAGWVAWTPDANGPAPVWAQGEAHSGTHFLSATRGRWRSPMIPVTPGTYYLAEAYVRGDGPGLWHALFFDGQGSKPDAAVDLATAKSGICTGTDAATTWQRQVMCFRPTPGITHAQFLLEPRGDKLLAVDDLTVREATWQEAAQWAQATYAAVPPIAYTPPADRWRNLPHTKRALQRGGSLRMVMLGSSNMNDIGSSYPELLLRQQYPKAQIEAIVSVRGSTGCNHYQAPEMVKSYILNYAPNLVLIECAGFDSTPESIRSVVKQVRAASRAEMLLVTSAWLDPAWLTPIDPNGADFFAGVMRVAAEEKVAFLDMSRPISRYFTDCGKPYEFFRRDKYHYNDRGKQVLAQHLARFFAKK
jgi:hypothetical protein